MRATPCLDQARKGEWSVQGREILHFMTLRGGKVALRNRTYLPPN